MGKGKEKTRPWQSRSMPSTYNGLGSIKLIIALQSLNKNFIEVFNIFFFLMMKGFF